MERRLSCIAFMLVLGLMSVLSDGSLRFVTVIWRHGDRTPSDGTFPTDTGNGDETWPQGFAELTQAGMRQHQHLGEFLRQRYVVDYNFLSVNYSTKEMFIRSTNYNRTIMSALSNTAGMYPTASGIDMLEDIPLWQPIPVHSRPLETDPMLWTDYPCQKVVDIYWKDVMTSDAVKQIEYENRDFMKFLQDKTGLTHQITLDDMWSIWDPLNCEKIYNDSHTWPNWMNESIFERLTDLMHLSTSFYYHDTRIQRFRGSLLFDDIAIRFDQKANRPAEIQPPQLKYYVYSAHDTTIVALLENLGAYNAHLPEYASAVLFELHEKQPGVFTVETWYSNETAAAKPPHRLIVKGCDDQPSGICDLKTFVRLAGLNVPVDYDAECNYGKLSDTTTYSPNVHPYCDHGKEEAATIAAVILAITTAGFFLAFLVMLLKYRRSVRTVKIAQSKSVY